MKNWRRTLGAVALAAATLLPAACGFDPGTIPVPGASISGPTYQIRIEFTNALNLPAQAKVVANGAKIGNLSSVAVIDPTPNSAGRIDATVEISSSVELPTTTTAQLQQNTILGDVYIGLTTPATDFGQTIQPGGVIPLAQTTPPLQVEDLLVGLSTFVGGGAVQQFQDIINRTNAALPPETRETRRIFDIIGRDVQDLAANQQSIDGFLDALEADLAVVTDNRAEVEALLSDRGATDIPAHANSIVLTLGIIGSIGGIGQALVWLGPLISAGDAAAKALVPLLFATNPLDLSSPSNLNSLVSLLRDEIIPFVERGPKVNITGVTVENSAVSTQDQVDAMVRALRMIGMVR